MASLDLREHFIDVGGRELVFHGTAYRLTFRGCGSPGLPLSGLTQRLTNPFGERHAMSLRNFLKLLDLVLFEEYL